MKYMNLGAVIRQDSGENSIMQTISIAVSAILIAAGLITAPSLINNARDTNAKSDLAAIAYGEEFANSNTGGYLQILTLGTDNTTVNGLKLFQNANGDANGAVKSTLSSGIDVYVKTTGSGTTSAYSALVQSVSGNYFYRDSTSSKITAYPKATTTFPITAPSGVTFSAAEIAAVTAP